ncbi:SDR family NAD(P)-dependent oxidoreductase [Spirillospora sp. NPDC047279]|uniref:SDR family NAD(P)-dependent oxidoreductase n=1 Tax=Spirillospora sp. NPDC047279 TaxID=3155478 RepID=UPI0033CDA73A
MPGRTCTSPRAGRIRPARPWPGLAEVGELDLGDLDGVRAFAERFLESGRTLDVIVNSAGIMPCPETRLGPGWEAHFAVNHLGHFALVNRLRPALAPSGARVVSVSSSGRFLSGMRWEDVHFRGGYDRWRAYAQSKTANALFALRLDALGAGAGLRAFAVHPGSILTPLRRRVPREERIAQGWVTPDGERAKGFKSPAQGAAAAVWAVTSPLLDDHGGAYCQDCDVTEPAGTGDMLVGGVKPWATDAGEAARLWDLSSDLTGLDMFSWEAPGDRPAGLEVPVAGRCRVFLMSTNAELFTIGQLARRCGVSARTVRFWSDAGLVPPAGRSAGGYRLYDAEAVGRLDLVRTLRELGLGLDVVEAVLSNAATVAEVATAHVAALDAEIRLLRVRRAVLSTIAQRASTVEETLLMHRLARMSAQERQQIIDDFVRYVVAGVDPESPAMGIAGSMRRMPAELPAEPAPEQVDAWVELGELVADDDFRERVRAMAVAGDGADELEYGPDHHAVAEHAGRALAEGIAPGSAEGRAVLDRIVPPDTPAGHRARILEQLEMFTDARVERYWQLLTIINGGIPYPAAVPSFEWLIAALRSGTAR